MKYYKVIQIIYIRNKDEIIGEYTGYMKAKTTKELENKLNSLRINYEKYDMHFLSIVCSYEEYEKNKCISMFFEDLNLEIIQ